MSRTPQNINQLLQKALKEQPEYNVYIYIYLCNIHGTHSHIRHIRRRKTDEQTTENNTHAPGRRRRKVRRMESRTKGSGGGKVGVPSVATKFRVVNVHEFSAYGWFSFAWLSMIMVCGHGRGDDDDHVIMLLLMMTTTMVMMIMLLMSCCCCCWWKWFYCR